MTRDRYYYTRGALAGVLASLSLLIGASCAGAFGGWLGAAPVAGVALAALAGQQCAAVLLAVAWLSDVRELSRMPREALEAFERQPPPIVSGNGENGHR